MLRAAGGFQTFQISFGQLLQDGLCATSEHTQTTYSRIAFGLMGLPKWHNFGPANLMRAAMYLILWRARRISAVPGPKEN